MEEQIKKINLGFVNAYLLSAGDGFILVDTGIAPQWSRLENELLQCGCLPERLKLVILTHGDMDHAGNCKKIQQKYGVNIAMHPGDLEMVKNGRTNKRHATDLTGKITTWLSSRMSAKNNCFEPNILLEDGQTLEAYGLSAKVIHTPGHTPGSITLLTSDSALIVGDTFSNRRKPQSASIIENDEELQKSLLRIKDLKAQMVYPGHGNPFPFEDLLKITN
jgi:glyoxylase-like metal-dependent hydrolase (beta-lactamase superfamily II)